MSYWRDKVAIVTGGSAGLGKSLAAALVERGARVVLAARSQPALDETCGQLATGHGHVLGVTTDVTLQESARQLIERTLEHWGRLDLLVNNAGRSDRGDVLATSPDKLRELWELNFLALARCTQLAAPHLIETRGHVINIGSLAAKVASPYLGAYPTSKFPVDAYSQQLRFELRPRGVHVLLVCTGPIRRDDAGVRYQTQSAGLPASAARPGGGVKLSALDPDQLAVRILRAAERRRPELIIPGHARLLFAAARLHAGLGDWLIGRFTGR